MAYEGTRLLASYANNGFRANFQSITQVFSVLQSVAAEPLDYVRFDFWLESIVAVFDSSSQS